MTLSWAGPSHAHNKNPAPSTIAARREVAILKSGSLDVRELKAAGAAHSRRPGTCPLYGPDARKFRECLYEATVHCESDEIVLSF